MHYSYPYDSFDLFPSPVAQTTEAQNPGTGILQSLVSVQPHIK